MKNAPSSTLGQTATRNSIYSMAVNIWYLLSRFLLTPLILHYLNLAEYGLWSLCFVVMGFLALSSMGLEATYIKYVAQFHAENRPDAINRLLSTGLLLTSGIALATITVLWLCLPLLHKILNVPAELTDKASFVFMGTGLIFMLDISLNCFARALDGFQYLALTAKIRFWSSLIELFLIVVFLYLGYGIYGLMTAFFIRYLLVIVVNIFFAYRLIPNLKLSPEFLDKASLRILISYGSKMQLLSIINIVSSTIDRMIISATLGLAANGLYEIGRKIPNKGARIPTEISGAIMPALSHLQGNSDMNGARQLFLQGSRYMAMLSAPLFCFFAATAPYAIFVWLGSGYEKASGIMSIISLATIVHLLTGASSALARGLNRLDWELKFSFLNLILCAILTPALAWFFGLTGAAAGVSVGLVISSIYFISRTHAFFKVRLAEYLPLVISPLLIALFLGVILHFTLAYVTFGVTSRIAVFTILSIAAGGYFLSFGALLYLFSNFSHEEKRWIHEKFSKLIPIRPINN